MKFIYDLASRSSLTLFTSLFLFLFLAQPGLAAPRPPYLLYSGLQGASGSTIGPDGALYVTEGMVGRISRVDPDSGAISTYASGLPPSIIPIGGVVDVEFIDNVAYALVTLVGTDLGGNSVVGIYRVDGPTTFTVIADIGQYSTQHPPATPYDLPTGLQYALESYRGTLLVTDGHHNRVLRVTLDGLISELGTFGNIVPTGLAVWGEHVYMAEAGPVPHHSQDGKVVSFTEKSHIRQVASGAPLLVDVEFGPNRKLFALAQGTYGGGGAGSPAIPGTGSLVEANANGRMQVIADQLNLPTSLEFIGNTAFVISLAGEIWKIDVSSPPFGRRH